MRRMGRQPGQVQRRHHQPTLTPHASSVAIPETPGQLQGRLLVWLPQKHLPDRIQHQVTLNLFSFNEKGSNIRPPNAKR